MQGNIYGRKTHDKVCLTELVCLTYKSHNGTVKSGIMNLEIEFSRSNLSIEYLDVEYSDSEMMELVENNPRILQNIDSYLRNKLLKVEYDI